ncbi:MAG TPA: 2Fe-2S iron-sulfur cluster-binding protein [Chitinophagales bacterium]|nr:2Fe-2S iron-sulfur cluster binding domain-containing protein [Chitinophagales bacterium]HMU97958.1 2Fe-2S iron-sulfur cluster-binding protein [Chitinophagales bacterium]HMV02914.1 2Fe-2S iron-sulfur cluster-binding protein [Chitinophagales bacterium]HMW93520.1 2Fe-2S iron-sulfur cluster-binding protein [Chitinophagales bacterium]HMY43161.1 2Fe-2S iron-sulfur cluster-binding protein [Chitinophagales bacterium]
MEHITIYIQQENFEFIPLEIPLGVDMSLMEVLKGEEHPIEAICGGMALCATCRVEVLNQDELNLDEKSDSELDILETLPCYTGNCRLTCQIRVSKEIDGMRIKFPEEVFA